VTGGLADVAERISVFEWVKVGDVVEIDPDHAGFFGKASALYSRRVAGIAAGNHPRERRLRSVSCVNTRWKD